MLSLFFVFDTELYELMGLALFAKDNLDTLWELLRTPTLEVSFLPLVLGGLIVVIAPRVLDVEL
jgi:hypothetical protein